MSFKPFFLPDAKAGKQVITDEGIIGEYKFSYTHLSHERHIFLFNVGNGNHFILSWCDRKGWIHGIDNGRLEDYKVGMAPVKKEEWVNIYEYKESPENLHLHQYKLGFGKWDCFEKAKEAGEEYQEETAGDMIYIKSVLIREWEE